MKLAAARAIADSVGEDLHPEYIVPSVFNRAVAPAVAAAVAAEAARSGLAHALADLVDPLHAGRRQSTPAMTPSADRLAGHRPVGSIHDHSAGSRPP